MIAENLLVENKSGRTSLGIDVRGRFTSADHTQRLKPSAVRIVDQTGQLPSSRLLGSYPETGFEEINSDVLEADFWGVREISFCPITDFWPRITSQLPVVHSLT